MYVRKCDSLLENRRFGGRTGPGAGSRSGWLPRKLKKVGTKRSYLQRSAPIQPKTSENLPKICRNFAKNWQCSSSKRCTTSPAKRARRWTWMPQMSQGSGRSGKTCQSIGNSCTLFGCIDIDFYEYMYIFILQPLFDIRKLVFLNFQSLGIVCHDLAICC